MIIYEMQHYLYDVRGQFHRLYMDSCSCLLGLDLEQITESYSKGVSSNLKLSQFDPELLRHTQSGLISGATEVDELAQLIMADLYQDAEPETLALLQNLRHLIAGERSVRMSQISDLEASFKERLVQCKSDYLARLVLAWLNFHYFHNHTVACAHFELVSTRAEKDKPYLAILALRYHARSFALLERHLESYSTQYHAIQLSQPVSQQLEYELIQYAFHNEQYFPHGKAKISSFIKEDTFNFLLCQSNAYINEIPDVIRILSDFHKAKLEEISELTWQHWSKQQPEVLKTLVADNSAGALEAIFSQHMELLGYQPYVVLYHSNHIKDKILKNLSGRTKGVYRTVDKILRHKIEAKYHHYTWINRIGHKLVYATAILVLSTLFVCIYDLLLSSSYQSVNWMMWLPFLLTLTLASVGLTWFSPPDVKKMLLERQVIARALAR